MAVTVCLKTSTRIIAFFSLFLSLLSTHNAARFSENLIRHAGGRKSLTLAIAKVRAKTVNYAQSYFCPTNISIEQSALCKNVISWEKEKCVFSCAPLSRASYMKDL